MLGRVGGFEAQCQRALLSVQITRHYTQLVLLLVKFTVLKYIYSSVSKVHAGSFRVSVIDRNLTWTTGSLMCVRDHSESSALPTRRTETD